MHFNHVIILCSHKLHHALIAAFMYMYTFDSSLLPFGVDVYNFIILYMLDLLFSFIYCWFHLGFFKWAWLERQAGMTNIFLI